MEQREGVEEEIVQIAESTAMVMEKGREAADSSLVFKKIIYMFLCLLHHEIIFQKCFTEILVQNCETMAATIISGDTSLIFLDVSSKTLLNSPDSP